MTDPPARRWLQRLHLALLHLFGRLPRRARLGLMHAVAPGYVVGALCLVERDDGSQLLVRSSYRRDWGLPGGLSKRGEPIDVTARRELREELGVDVELRGEPAVVVDARARRVDVVYLARLVAGGAGAPPPDPTSPELLEARWFPPEALPPLQAESAEALVALARRRDAPGRASAPRRDPVDDG